MIVDADVHNHAVVNQHYNITVCLKNNQRIALKLPSNLVLNLRPQLYNPAMMLVIVPSL